MIGLSQRQMTFLPRAIMALCVLALSVQSARAVSTVLWALRKELAPQILARLSAALNRAVTYERIYLDPAGELQVTGIRVRQTRDPKSGVLLAVERATLQYDPQLTDSGSWLHGAEFGREARFSATGVSLFLPDHRAGIPFARADLVETRFDLHRAILSRAPPSTWLGDIHVQGADLRVARGTDGRWNYESLLTSAPKTKDPLTLELSVTNSVLSLVDYKCGSLPSPQHNRFRGGARVLFGPAPVISFTAAGRLFGEHSEPVSVAGSVLKKRGVQLLRLRAQSDRPNYWQQYLNLQRSGWVITEGNARAVVTLWREEFGPGLDYRADVDFRKGTILNPMLGRPAREVQGRLVAQPGIYRFSGRGKILASRFDVEALARPDVDQVELTATTLRTTAEELQSAIPALHLPRNPRLEGPFAGVIRARKQGDRWKLTASVPSVRLQAEFGEQSWTARSAQVDLAAEWTPGSPGIIRVLGRATSISSPRYRIDQPALSLTWAAGDLTLDARGVFAGGTIVGGGVITPSDAGARDESRLDLKGSFRGVDLALLLPDSTLAPRGWADGTFEIHGTTVAPSFEAGVDVARSEVGGYSLSHARAIVRGTAGHYELIDASLGALGGEIRAQGVLDDRALALTYQAYNIDASQLQVGAEAPVAGLFSSTGEVRGSLDDPRITGVFEGSGTAFRDWRGDRISGSIQANAHSVQVFDLNLDSSGLSAVGERLGIRRSGVDQPWELSGSARTRAPQSLYRLARWLGVSRESLLAWGLSAELSNVDIRVSGTSEAPVLEVRAEVSRAFGRGQSLGDGVVSARVNLAERYAEVLSLELTEGLQTLTSAGRFEWSDTVPIQIAGQADYLLSGIRLQTVLDRFASTASDYLDIEGGELQVAGQVVIARSTPVRANGSVRCTDLIVNGRQVDVSPIVVHWDPETARLEEIALGLGSGRLRITPGSFRLTGKRDIWELLRGTSAELRIERLELSVLRQMFEDSPFYGSTRNAALRTRLREWGLPIRGHVDGLVRAAAPSASNAISDGAFAFRLSVPDFSLTAGPSEALSRIDAEGSVSREALSLSQFVATGTEGARISATAQVTKSPTGRGPAGVVARVLGVNLGLEGLSRAPIRGLAASLEAWRPLNGVLGFDAQVRGSLDAPVIELNANASSLVVGGVPIAAVEARQWVLNAAARKLDLKALDLRLFNADPTDPSLPLGEVSLSGYLPILWPNLSLDSELPRELRVDMPRQSLSALTRLANAAETRAGPTGRMTARLTSLVQWFRVIAATKGIVEGHLVLGGTPTAPRNSGQISVTGAEFRVDKASTHLRDVEALLQLKGDELEVTRLAGQSSAGGSISGGGTVRLAVPQDGMPAAQFSLDLSLQALRIDEPKGLPPLTGGFRLGRSSFTLNTVLRDKPSQSAPVRLLGRWPDLLISGAVQLDDADVLVLFEAPTTSREPVAPSPVTLALDLIAGKKVAIRTPQIRLTLAGKLQAERSLTQPRLTGLLTVPRGSFAIPGLRLTNVEGQVRVDFDGSRPPDNRVPPVNLDIKGGTTMRYQRALGLEAEDYDVTFRIRGGPGGAADPVIRATTLGNGLEIGSSDGLQLGIVTDPPLPAQEITALIRQRFGVGGFDQRGANVEQNLWSSVQRAFASNLAGTFTTMIEDRVQSALKLDIFSLELGIADPVRLRLGKRLFDRVYGTVSQGFGTTARGRRVEIYYRFSPKFRFGVRQEEPVLDRVFFFSGTTTF